MSLLQLQSNLALRVYRHVWHGTDVFLGHTLPDSADAQDPAVRVPEDMLWYVRHCDPAITDDYVATLAAEVATKGIPGLSLASCRLLTNGCLPAILTAPKLRLLDLFNTPVSGHATASLQGLTELEALVLAGTSTVPSALAELGKLPALRYLHLGWTNVDDAALQALAACKSLTHLDLRHSAVTDTGLECLSLFPKLVSLDLQGTKVSDRGIEMLARLKDSLEHLYLGYTPITSASLSSLKALSRLRTLMLRGTQLPRDNDPNLLAELPLLSEKDPSSSEAQRGLIR